MKILVLNCGSSSLKYQLLDMSTERVIAKGNFERIGEKESFLTHKMNREKYVYNEVAMNHEEALNLIMKELQNPDHRAIENLSEINAIGHRVVAGGEIFDKSVIIDEKTLKGIEACSKLAPLHNPAAILGIKACQKAMPGVPMVAAFDTAFHQTMPKENYLYPIPYEYYEKYGIRKYGAHGTSHKYVTQRVEKLMNKDIKALKIVTCHLGQGASLCAVQGGKSVAVGTDCHMKSMVLVFVEDHQIGTHIFLSRNCIPITEAAETRTSFSSGKQTNTQSIKTTIIIVMQGGNIHITS